MNDELIKRLYEKTVVSNAFGEKYNANLFADAAGLIEQQAAALEAANARIAELEAAIRKQANAARSLADATIRDASIRQGLAEKAYAESSPEVLASERQANAMLTEENERLSARLAAIESAAKAEPVAYMDARALERLKANPNKGYSVWGSALEGDDIPLYTAPTAALAQPLEAQADARDARRYRWLKERYTGFDFDWMADDDGKNGKQVICFQMDSDMRIGRDITAAIDAALANQKQAG